MKTRLLTSAAMAALLMAFVPACGSDDDSTASDDTTETTAATASEPTIDGVWARTSPMDVSMGAVYMNITGGAEGDELTGASVDATIAGTVEVHETVESTGGDSMSSTTAMGGDMASTTAAGDTMSSTTLAPTMEMRPVESIEIPAGETVELKPGGYHVMLIDLVKPLALGEKFDVTLTFATAGEVTVEAEVKDAP